MYLGSFSTDQMVLELTKILLVIRDSQVLAKLVVVTIFFIGWDKLQDYREFDKIPPTEYKQKLNNNKLHDYREFDKIPPIEY